jgi:outer membrane biosynthesis protein TonB
MPSHTDEIKPTPSPEELQSGELVAEENETLQGLPKAIHRKAYGELRTRKALFTSLGLHLIAPPSLIILFLVLAWVLHWDIWSWLNPKPKSDEVAFTLVLDTHAPKPKKALYKGPFNQAAGGHSKPEIKPKPKVTEHSSPIPLKHSTAKAITPKPQTIDPSKRVQENPKETQIVTPVAIKEPQKTEEPAIKTSTTPTTTETQATQPPQETQSVAQNGPNPTEGVNVSQDVALGPLLADLEKRIKHNWIPPRGSESRKVQLMLYVQRDGRLLKIETMVSSGDQNTDLAAVSAAEASAPFMALPKQILEDVLPIEFTFDYNVLNSPKHKQL